MIKAFEDFTTHHFKKDVQPSVEECKQNSDSDENVSGYAEDLNEVNDENIFEDFPIKRLACIAHAINNTLNISIMGSKRFKIEPVSEIRKLVKKVEEICSKIKNNGRSVDYFSKHGASASMPAKTRWIYQYLTIKNFLENKESFKYCIDNFLNGLVKFPSKLDMLNLEKIQTTLKSFYTFILNIEADKNISISYVYPGVINIMSMLETSDSSFFGQWYRNIKKDIERRLDNVINPDSVNFNDLYATATFLDPKTYHIFTLDDFKTMRLLIVQRLNAKYGEPVIKQQEEDSEFEFLFKNRRDSFKNETEFNEIVT